MKKTRMRGAERLCAALLSLALMGLCVSVMTGCAQRTKPDASDYAGQARYAYEGAMSAFESSEYLEALKQFNYVRTKFPYSKYSALASLRIGDTYFAQDQTASAIEAYKRFLQLHPTHPDVPYAEYRIGMAYYQQLPGDWFFMPPAYEKDLASTEDAERALKRFLDNHPNSQYAEEISEKLRIVRQRLADHEFFVASFYIKRNKPRAAAMRLTYLLEKFPGIGFDEEALFLKGKCFVMMKNVPAAVETWQDLIAQYPAHPLTVKAQDYLRVYRLGTPAESGPAVP